MSVFMWKGKKVTLIPTNASSTQRKNRDQGIKQNVLLGANLKEFEKEVKGSKLILDILAKEQSTNQETIPP